MSDAKNELSITEAADLAGISVSTLYARMREGKIKPFVNKWNRTMFFRADVLALEPAPRGRPAKEQS